MSDQDHPDSLALGILRRIVNAPETDESYVNFGYEWEVPFFDIETRIPVTEDELDLLVSLEGTP